MTFSAILPFPKLSIKNIPGISATQIKQFEVEQMRMVNRLLWFTQLVHLASSLFLNLIFFEQFNNSYANILTILIVLLVIARLLIAYNVISVAEVFNNRTFDWRAHTCFTGAMSILFALYCGYVFEYVTGDQRLLISIFITGIIAGGTILLSTMPIVAIAWVVPLTICIINIAVGFENKLVGQVLTVLVIIFSLVMFLAIFVVHRMTILNLKAQVVTHSQRMKAERQSETIGLLLRDFEEQVNDWLWELDTHRVVVHIPSKIRYIIGATGEFSTHQKQTSLVHLFETALKSKSADQQPYLQNLQEKLDEGVSFSDVMMPALLNSERWLKISAKPIYDKRGNFSGWRGLCADITSEYLNRKHIENLANYDSLTGLANRYHFNQSIEERCKNMRRFSLILLDLDNFKYVNDTFGHAQGDVLLQKFAECMQTAIGRCGLLCRLGGDEFAVISEEIETIEGTMRKLSDALTHPIELENANVEVSVSIGVSIFPDDASDEKNLFSRADIAMYNAKSQSSHSIVFFSPEMERRSYERSEMVACLRKAIKENELSLVYQPQISVTKQSIIGFEALMRWHSNELGIVSPIKFIALAEESGLIIDLGYWALEKACQHALTWQDNIPVSVNVSGIQLLSKGFEDKVRDILTRTGLVPDRLHLEVTESSIVTKIYQANQILTRLQKVGVKVSLDDFGTGFSSLSYLQRLSIDSLKIDRSFVQGLDSEDDLANSIAIIDIIFKLADVLGLSVMVEGVETEFHLNQLAKLGCENIQGYWFSAPIPESDTATYINEFQYY